MDKNAPDSLVEQRYEEYFHLLGIALLYWDHILTFAMEVEFLWKHFGSMSSYMFFLNRYFSSLGVMAVTYSLFSGSIPTSVCESFHLYREILLVLTQVFVCILLTLRIYALYGRSTRMLVYMLSFGFFLAGVACFALFFGEESESLVSEMGCHTQLQFITAVRVASAWEALFVYDSMLVVLTLKKAYETRRELKEEGMLVPSILVLVVRDGSIYFAVMAVANFLNILTFYLTGPYMRGGLSTFASAVSVTMMSRLMLNLHEVAETGLYTSHRETCQFGTQSGILTHLTDESDDYFTYRCNKQTTHHLQA